MVAFGATVASMTASVPTIRWGLTALKRPVGLAGLQTTAGAMERSPYATQKPIAADNARPVSAPATLYVHPNWGALDAFQAMQRAARRQHRYVMPATSPAADVSLTPIAPQAHALMRKTAPPFATARVKVLI